jgi:hemolysin activation/secretion protein
MSKGQRAPARSRGLAAPACIALALAAAGAHAQTTAPAAPPPVPAPAAPAVFAIQGFTVTGENPLGDGETARVLAPFVRPDATIETLQQATQALETALRTKGYGLHRVALPPQEVGAKVRLEIVTFSVSKVVIDGRSLYDEGNVRRTLPELQEGRTPNFKTLAVQTAIANENPNKQVQVGIREGEEPDKIDATITVKEQRPWTFGVSASNSGTESTGRDRLSIVGGHTNLFNLDHQFTGAYTTSLERSSDVKQLGLAYKIPLYALGGVIGASYTRSDVVGNFGAFSSTGAGRTAGVSYTWYLPPDGGRRSYVALSLDDKLFKATRINDQLVPGALDRRSRPLTLGWNTRIESDSSVVAFNVDLAVNLPSGEANELVNYQSEDPRIETTKWSTLRGTASYLAPFGQGWLLSLRGAFQASSQVLISGEQFGLGGLGSVRGTSIERPISGDYGVSGTAEVSTPELAPGLRLFAFTDAGMLGNNRSNDTNRPGSDELASVGVGLRWFSGPYSVTGDYGRIVRGSKVPLAFNSASPQRGDDRFYLSLGLRF